MSLSPSLFAKNLSELLRSYFPIENREELAVIIDFNARFIEQHREELAGLLFIEFSECDGPVITLNTAKKIVARVQKRIYRDTLKREQSLEIEVESKHSSTSTEEKRIIEEFMATLSTEDILLFQLRYVEGCPVIDICQELGAKKSNIYERLSRIEESFKRFVQDGA